MDKGYLLNFISTLYGRIRTDDEGNKIISQYDYDLMERILFPERFKDEEN